MILYDNIVVLFVLLLIKDYLTACPINCETCHNYTLCTQCKSEYYGQRCKKECDKCIDKQCDLLSCNNGCEVGKYKTLVHGKASCRKCHRHCKYCKDYNHCRVCEDGHFLYQFQDNRTRCDTCPEHVTDCQSYCKIQFCKDCIVRNRSNVCNRCDQGYKLKANNCFDKKEVCSEGCLTECDSVGICNGNCKDGLTGDQCADPCSANCLKCQKNDRNFCRMCKDGFYTRTCNVECPTACKRVAGSQTCNIVDGNCLTECGDNFWGKFCNESCSVGCAVGEDNSTRCTRSGGKCMNGCKDGFVGDKCIAIKTSVKKSRGGFVPEHSRGTTFSGVDTTRAVIGGGLDTSRQDDSMHVVVIGSVAGGGAAFLIVASLSIACFIKKRQKTRRTENGNRREKGDIMAVEANVNFQPVVFGNDDCLYAQVNKMNKKNNFGKKEPQTAGSKICYDFEVEEVMVDTLNVDDSDLEEIGEEKICSMESEVNIPSQDTYYNTASLLRSRTAVSNLSEYISNKSDYKKEFERLPVGLTRACTEAFKPNNRVKNRYNGIYAYDATRVILKSGNYVNANLIDGNKEYPAYIASLGPTKSTMNNFATFWEMIWQEKTDKIVMLTNLDEAKKMKCEQYWPVQQNENKYGDYKVRCTAEKVFSEFIEREFIVAQGNDKREVTQYQYTAWPDKTVPDSVASLLEFRDIVEQKQSTTAGPMMVHCSAGIGRTGTYIALDILIKEGKDDNSVDIFGCVNALRGQRVQLVQNLEQYVYLHHCVLYALSCAPEPRPVSNMTHFTSDERLSAQHKAFVSLQHLTNRDKKMGTKNVTRKENRTGADIPDEKHRVRLGLIEKDYINAVYVNGYQECNKFILAQTPLQGTLEDFVSMLYQERCSCVVCLDDENVIDKSIVQYLPLVNKVATFGQFQVICTDIDRKQDFISRKLNVSRIGVSLSDEVSVSHYQFKGWSSIDCVPRSIQSFLNLVTDVEKTYQSLNSKHPIVVHCSTGAERSGLFCAVSILLEKVAVEKEVSVLNTVCQVCSRRRSAFQDIEHFRFCYSCVEQMSEISDSSTYYNSRNM